jgi:uncharacterized membrane protein YfcA
MLTLEYWYLLPAATLIATIATASGIGGGVFFSPLFILGLKMEPSVAVATALVTQVFGFTSAFVTYLRRRLVDFRLGKSLLIFSIPTAVVGSLNASFVPANALKSLFAVGMFFIGWQLFRSYRQEAHDNHIRATEPQTDEAAESVLIDRAGKVYRYSICHQKRGRLLAGIGGALLGMISVGLAELQMYHLIGRCRVPPAVAVATTIFVVVITLLVASSGYFFHYFSNAEQESINQIFRIVAFTVPGVLIGGQLGPLLQVRIDPDIAKPGIAALVVVVGALMLVTLS